MQIVRTIIWVLLLVALLLFSIANWDPTVTVRIWENLVVDTKIPAIVVVSFLIGFVPMWLYHRASKWQMRRKIASLEAAARTSAATPVAPDRPLDQDRLEREAAERRAAEERAAHEHARADVAEERRDDALSPEHDHDSVTGKPRLP